MSQRATEELVETTQKAGWQTLGRINANDCIGMRALHRQLVYRKEHPEQLRVTFGVGTR